MELESLPSEFLVSTDGLAGCAADSPLGSAVAEVAWEDSLFFEQPGAKTAIAHIASKEAVFMTP